MNNMIIIPTPLELNITAVMYQKHLLIRRTKTDKNGRRISYGPFYNAEHELSFRFRQFSSSECKWMKANLNDDVNKFPLSNHPCPAIFIKYD